LTDQVHLYSIDTSAFYTEVEREIHEQMRPLYFERKKLSEDKSSNNKRISEINTELKELKSQLKKEITLNKTIRNLNPAELTDYNIVSMFESTLTRVIQCRTNELTHELMIIRVFYFGVLEDIIKEGFFYNGEKYIFFCASAGQIRKKMVVCIKESTYLKHQNTLMCGMTDDIINSHGGMNINKKIAYTALCNTATEQWRNFDINKCIVVPDFETLVEGDVDRLEWDTFEINRQTKEVLIPHTDGCGIMLPSVSDKNFIVRLPFIKGLLTPFDYIEFIKEHKANPVVTDIYGKKHNVITDDIQVIFTESQFKMHKYYNSWNEYKTNFVNYKCQAGVCGLEQDRINEAKINYQMLQTLYDMSKKDIEKISMRTAEEIKAIGRNEHVSLSVLGARNNNFERNDLQKALNLYPPLMQDGHSKQILKDKKKKLVKRAKAGKLKLACKYTYVIPDIYAFCERLFLGIDKPKGLLQGNEVYCNMYQNNQEIDCLRSPHLYIEHALRTNKVNSDLQKWFTTKGIYTSSYDLISKLLFFDVDGDILLLCTDKTILRNARKIVDRHKVVPLDYETKKAVSEEITPGAVYNGMIRSYTGGNIGEISNQLTKVWNKDVVTDEDVYVSKILVALNNLVIDFAKNLWKPEIPVNIQELIKSKTKEKLPYFFIYAKDKTKEQVLAKNKSLMNQLDSIIPSTRIYFKDSEPFDYNVLMSNKNINIDTELASNIITQYETLDLKKPFVINSYNKDFDSTTYIYNEIKRELLKNVNDEKYITDILIEYLYTNKQKHKKTTLWECFGNQIVQNIKKNLKLKNEHYCLSCGALIIKNSRKMYCDECSKEINKKKSREKYQRMGNKTLQCKRCEKSFEVKATSRRQYCDECIEYFDNR
jgi:hypothetical protein